MGAWDERGWIAIGRLLIACSLAGCLLFTATAEAKEFRVTRTSDPAPGACKKHDCSLREAISAADARAGRDTVQLRSGKTYRQTRLPSGEDENAGGDFDVTGPLTIKASGKGRAAIDARQTDRVMQAISTKLTLDRLTLKNGSVDGAGGGLYASASSVRIKSSRIEHNLVNQFNGGGIEASSTLGEDPSRLHISGSTITRNSSFGFGGGIDAQAKLVITGTTISHNRPTSGGAYGGGLFVGGPATLSHDRILTNRTAAQGGGIFASSDRKLAIDHTVVSDNESADAGGGISILSLFPVQPFVAATISTSTIAGNRAGGHGGGLANSRLLKVTRSTFSDNETAIGGGAIANRQLAGAGPTQIELINDTLASNRANGYGGGIDNFDGASALLNSVTVTRNRADAENNGGGAGGGIHNSIQQSNVPIYNVRDSLIAGNKVGSSGSAPDCFGDFISLGHNLVSDPASCTGFDQVGDRVEPNPRLGALSNNGGPTRTVPLRKGSPAIGQGDSDCPRTDQRGVRRKDCDIGAFERR